MVQVNYKFFFSRYKQLEGVGAPEDYKDFLEDQTGKRSLKELSDKEYQKVINTIKQVKLPKRPFIGDSQRKRIIANFHDLGFSDAVAEAKRWAEKRTKTSFNQIDLATLGKLVSTSDKMVQNHDEKQREHLKNGN